MEPVPNPLAFVLERACNVNAFWTGWEEHVRSLLDQLGPEQAELFQQQMADAILKKTITPGQYVALTSDDRHADNEAVSAWLKVLWNTYYGAHARPELYATEEDVD